MNWFLGIQTGHLQLVRLGRLCSILIFQSFLGVFETKALENLRLVSLILFF